MSVHGYLEMAKKAGGVLHLVNDDGWRMALQEALWLLLGLLSFCGQIEGYEFVIREQVPECRGLAGLPCAGENDDRARLGRAL